MATTGKLHEFGLEIGKPHRTLGKPNVTGLDDCRLRRHACNLIVFRLKADRADANVAIRSEILDQVRTRSFVFDNDAIRPMRLGMLNDASPQSGIFKPFAQNVNKVVVVILHKPGGADRIVIELFGLRRGVPTLNDFVVGTLTGQVAVPLEP